MIQANRLADDFPQLEDDAFKLMLISTIVGVRSPDTEGHATSNLARLRQIHADPDPAGQYAHALRGALDDGAAGDEAAILGLRNAIVELVVKSLESYRAPPNEQLISVPLYFDFYGIINIEVWAPAYYLGRALHALQDSFAHTIRNDDLTLIRHVLNYVDAIEGHLEESRDGLPHSAHMDSCEGDILPIAMTAMTASAQLIAGVNRTVEMENIEFTKEVLFQWLGYEPGCTFENDYCDSAWVALARQEQTGPYLEEALGCNHGSPAKPLHWSWLLALALLIGATRRRQLLLIAPFALLFIVSAPKAEPFLRAESHISLLSDAPERSVLASTFGFGFRGGYGIGDWRVLGHLERNFWLSTELSDRVRSGALNLGLGAEFSSARDFVRTNAVIGVSRLQYDTLFHDRGTSGIFFDVRPVELCWKLTMGMGFTLTPLSFTYVSPVMKTPAIRMVLYRTILGLEGRF